MILSGDIQRTVELQIEKRDYTGAFIVTSLKDYEKFEESKEDSV